MLKDDLQVALQISSGDYYKAPEMMGRMGFEGAQGSAELYEKTYPSILSGTLGLLN